MFKKLLILLGIKYDFSQWDRGKFPLGIDHHNGTLPQDWITQIYDKDREFIISPHTARLLKGYNDTLWPGEFRVDENLPHKPRGKHLKPDALRLRKILASRGAL